MFCTHIKKKILRKAIWNYEQNLAKKSKEGLPDVLKFYLAATTPVGIIPSLSGFINIISYGWTPTNALLAFGPITCWAGLTCCILGLPVAIKCVGQENKRAHIEAEIEDIKTVLKYKNENKDVKEVYNKKHNELIELKQARKEELKNLSR